MLPNLQYIRPFIPTVVPLSLALSLWCSRCVSLSGVCVVYCVQMFCVRRMRLPHIVQTQTQKYRHTDSLKQAHTRQTQCTSACNIRSRARACGVLCLPAHVCVYEHSTSVEGGRTGLPINVSSCVSCRPTRARARNITTNLHSV